MHLILRWWQHWKVIERKVLGIYLTRLQLRKCEIKIFEMEIELTKTQTLCVISGLMIAEDIQLKLGIISNHDSSMYPLTHFRSADQWAGWVACAIVLLFSIVLLILIVCAWLWMCVLYRVDYRAKQKIISVHKVLCAWVVLQRESSVQRPLKLSSK